MYRNPHRSLGYMKGSQRKTPRSFSSEYSPCHIFQQHTRARGIGAGTFLVRASESRPGSFAVRCASLLVSCSRLFPMPSGYPVPQCFFCDTEQGAVFSSARELFIVLSTVTKQPDSLCASKKHQHSQHYQIASTTTAQNLWITAPLQMESLQHSSLVS